MLDNIIEMNKINIIESIIMQIFKLYTTSMNFRYRINKQGQENIPNILLTDLYVIKFWIDVFDTILYHTYNE